MMVRVLHISSLYPPVQVGGAEKSVEGLAETQAALGCEVAVACGDRLGRPPEVVRGVEVNRLKYKTLFWMEDAAAVGLPKRQLSKLMEGVNVPYASSFGEVVERFRPQIIHTHSLVSLTPLVWKLGGVAGAKVVHTIRDYDLICRRSSMLARGAACTRRCIGCICVTAPKAYLHKYVDAVVGVSEDVLATHVSLGFFTQVPLGLRRVIWNSTADVSAVTPSRDRSVVTFAFVGRDSPEKGLLSLFDACRLLSPGGWRLIVAGIDMDSACVDAAKGLPVDFVGWVNTHELLPEIDVLVVPSLYAEPLGRVTIEAFSHGVPVLGSAIGGTLELIGATNTEWLFQPGDAAGLAARMSHVIACRGSLKPPLERMEHVVAQTRPVVVASKYLRLYQDVMQ